MPITFTYDGHDHTNDLRSCHWTPLKGLIAWQENLDDWALLSAAYATARKQVLAAEPRTEDTHDG